MAWIKLHSSVTTNRKILTVADLLRISEAAAIGHLSMLWLWSIENAPGGVITVGSEMVRRVSGYPKAGRSFVDALVAAELLRATPDGKLHIVNYDEHIAPILVATDRNRKKTQAFRERQSAMRISGAQSLPGT